jgi:alginate O-acetyltransferase complex protein AlgJ
MMSASDTASGSSSNAEGASWASKVLNVLFCVAITLPLVGTFWTKPGGTDIAQTENRNAVALPEPPKTFEEWKQYPPKVEAFANDHFTFRKQLLDQHHALKTSLGISTSPMVTIGKEDWYFFSHPAEWNDVSGRHRFSTLEKARWLAYLNRAHDLLRERGIPFVVAIAPDKSSIYPEYLPAHGVGGTRKERLNELLAFLKENQCKVNVLDLREPLRSRKQDGLLFFKHDTHWNHFGAAIATQSIFQRLHDLGVPVPHSQQPVSPNDFEWTSQARPGDLGPTTELVPEPKPRPRSPYEMERNPAGLASLYPGMLEHPQHRVITHCQSGKGRLLMFRDSFTIALYDAISSSFEHVDYLWLYPSEQQLMHAVQLLQPTVVILTLVERNIVMLPNSGPAYEEGALIPQFLQEDIYTLTKKKVEHLRVAAGHATLAPYKSGFALSHQGGTPEIRMDRLPPLRKGLKAFQCIVRSPAASVFQLRDSSGLSLGEVPLVPGNNQVALFLPYGDLKGPLSIRLGSARGEYTFRQLSILGAKTTANASTSAARPAPEGE